MEIKRIIHDVSAIPNIMYNALILRIKKVRHGEALHINGRIGVHGLRGYITVGDNVTINSAPNMNSTGGGQQTHLNALGGKLIIGNNVGISHTAITAREYVKIENDVLIGTNCMIADTDFHSLEYECRMQEPDNHVKTKPVIIKEGAWLGARCIILKGVTLENIPLSEPVQL